MTHARNLINKQVHLYMSNWQYALLYTLILTVLPFTSWLAVAGISLLTLRRGLLVGLSVLVPVVVVDYFISLKSLTHLGALISTCVLFIPCFIGALVLRVTSTWQAVASVFFLCIAVSALLVQILAPDFVIKQYTYLESVIQKSQVDGAVVNFITDLSNINKPIIASYAFGLQLSSIFISAFIALMFARALQSKLYNVGGFKTEALGFRANKIAVYVLVILFLGIIKQYMLAMMLLPAAFIYFLFAGISICTNHINKRNSKLTLLALIPIAIFPVVSVPFYSFLGLFDSLISLRFHAFKRRNRG